MKPNERVTLCSECEMCPEVKLYDDHATIGEEGNLVNLKAEEWNSLVEKIGNGELGKI